MVAVGAYEAKTHLSRLLERVAKGERITITKHGMPIAVLAPASVLPAKHAAQTIARLREFRRGRKLGRGSLKQMIEKGRR
jgi:prevent-host-death family protein